MTATRRMTAREREAMRDIGRAVARPDRADRIAVAYDRLDPEERATFDLHVRAAFDRYIRAQPKPEPHSVCAKCGEHYGDRTNPTITTLAECIPCYLFGLNEGAGAR